MSRPIPCDACRALGCSCDGISHTCPTCGHVCTVHPSKEPHHAQSQEERRIESQRQHPSAVGPVLDLERELLTGDTFDRIVAELEAERAQADPCTRRDHRGVPRPTRRMEVRRVDPYHDQPGPSRLELVAITAFTIGFAGYCLAWLWSHR